MKLNLSDPRVLKMVLNNHHPVELWALDGTLRDVQCETCRHSWPCDTIELAQRFKETQTAIHAARIRLGDKQ